MRGFMRKTDARPIAPRLPGVLGAACLAVFVAQTPAHAAADITNFNIKNCTSERIFVCSFDKNDSLMKIPYKARGIQPGDRKEFGCASIGRCKVIIGVSRKTSKNTLSSGMTTALSATSGAGAALAVGSVGGLYIAYLAGVPAAASGALMLAMPVATLGAIVSVGVGGAVAGIEIADGWSDGEVCNQVRKAAEKAGLKPKEFLQNGKKYRVVPTYAADNQGNPYVKADGTAVFAYAAETGNSCPAPLKTQLVPN
jgi:hypothetical protein